VVTIRKWFANVDGKSGFSEMAIKSLSMKVELKRDVKVLVAVMLDDMALGKEVQFNSSNQQFRGFVDIGCGPADLMM